MKYNKNKVEEILSKTSKQKFDFPKEFWEREDCLEKFMEYLESNQDRKNKFHGQMKYLREHGGDHSQLIKWVKQKEMIAELFEPARIYD